MYSCIHNVSKKFQKSVWSKIQLFSWDNINGNTYFNYYLCSGSGLAGEKCLSYVLLDPTLLHVHTYSIPYSIPHSHSLPLKSTLSCDTPHHLCYYVLCSVLSVHSLPSAVLFQLFAKNCYLILHHGILIFAPPLLFSWASVLYWLSAVIPCPCCPILPCYSIPLFLTRDFSSSLVIIIMLAVCCSQTILQNSPKVSGRDP